MEVGRSFFVGDMAGRQGDPGSTDKGFAESVGRERGAALAFHTPEAYFGPAGVSREGDQAV